MKIKKDRLEAKPLLLGSRPTILLQTEVVESLMPHLSVEADNDRMTTALYCVIVDYKLELDNIMPTMPLLTTSYASNL